MQKLIKFTLYLFVVITGLTALMSIIGIGYIWFFSSKTELPHLNWLLSTVLAEVIIVTILFAKKGLKYLPESQTDKTPKDTLLFMGNFISNGTSATIVSNRMSWLANNEKLIEIIREKIQSGMRIEIITPNSVPLTLIENLDGANFIVTNEEIPPKSRFTLINGDRSGSEKLAIARGVHPEHEITTFDNNSGPQIIAMAQDIIRKSKGLQNAS